jgi:hypothetical protein
MKAKDKRDASDDKNIELDTQQLKRIRQSISVATNKGFYNVTVYETIRPVNVDQLKADGFNVVKEGGRNGENNYLIKWDTAE